MFIFVPFFIFLQLNAVNPAFGQTAFYCNDKKAYRWESDIISDIPPLWEKQIWIIAISWVRIPASPSR